jgi:hypothetical protein
MVLVVKLRVWTDLQPVVQGRRYRSKDQGVSGYVSRIR